MKKNITQEEHKFHSWCQVEAWPDFVVGEINAKSPPFFLPSRFIFEIEKTNYGKCGLTVQAVNTLPTLPQASLAGPLLPHSGEINR